MASFCMKCVFFLTIFLIFGVPSFYSYTDSGYLTEARNIWQNWIFSKSESAPFIPEVFDSPGYPFFVAFSLFFSGSIFVHIFLQIILMSFSAIILYRLLDSFFSEKIRFWSSLLYAVEPWNTFISSTVLSESVFLFSFLLGLYWLKRAILETNIKNAMLSGLIISASILIRPVILYLPLAFIMTFFIAKYQKGILRALIYSLVLLITFYSLVFFWTLRNYNHFGIFTFSTRGPVTLYFSDVHQLLVYQNNISADKASQRLLAIAKKDYPQINSLEELQDSKYASYLTKKSFKIIKDSPFDYFKLHTISIATFFLSDGYRLLLKEIGVNTPPLPNISFLIFHGKFSEIFLYFKTNLRITAIFVAGAVFWFVILFLSLLSPFLSRLSKNNISLKFVIICFLAIIFYFAVITGPVARARYRIPITPFLFTLAVFSFFKLGDRFYLRKQTGRAIT